MTSSGRFTRQQIAEIDVFLSAIERCEKQMRQLEAEQLAALARAMQCALGDDDDGGEARELAYRSLRLELATALQESEHTAERLLSTAYIAIEHLSAAHQALQAGEISLSHLRVIVDEGAPLTVRQSADSDAEQARKMAQYEREMLEFAREETPNRLRPIARRLAAAHSEQSMAERHAEALKRRCVRVIPADEGMADLVAHLPAEDAYAIRDLVQQLAKQALALSGNEVAEGPNAGVAPVTHVARDSRTRGEAGADVFRDLLLGSGTEVGEAASLPASRVRAHIQVVIPEHGAAELVGYGPIDSATAVRVAQGAAAWDRVTVDEAGGVISVDRYRPSAEMARFLAARDLHCRAPGCRVPAKRCDLDHTVDAVRGGATSTVNLAHLCRGHHMIKHHTDWQVSQGSDGVVTWVSPTGRRHLDRPPSRVRFRRADE
ncbi:uncharacterized protein DUF222 [Leucobacter komagatae]|uniref:Uncharacterized protein DUF222 n=1 Tax=Leucobacter komagatae TaxID=55969 RepID=A0A542Y460_9MICO|nr:HNH endonuclease signature motif containing protein [Leucobacter komagatae]TQL42853.1 uncharacterized protein DUF222 [Leucobacter komagatae]